MSMLAGLVVWATPLLLPNAALAASATIKTAPHGEVFESGAVILLNGTDQKTKNDNQNPDTALIGKKAGKKIKAGDRVQVRNLDGALLRSSISQA